MQFILPLLFIFFLAGCTQNNVAEPKKKEHSSIYSTENNTNQEHVFGSLNETIIDIADQLFKSNVNKSSPIRLILTSFVDLNHLDSTTTFGRLIGESMFNELHLRKFKISDFRGQEAVNVSDDGEFHITRDSEKLKETIDGIEFILVGTYIKFEDKSLLVNARILDSITGEVISVARVIYKPKNCAVYNLCEPLMIKEIKIDSIDSNKTQSKYFNSMIIIEDKDANKQ